MCRGRRGDDEPLEGRYTFLAADGDVEAPRGTFVFIPPGVHHGFRTEEDGSAYSAFWPSTVEESFFGTSIDAAMTRTWGEGEAALRATASSRVAGSS